MQFHLFTQPTIYKEGAWITINAKHIETSELMLLEGAKGETKGFVTTNGNKGKRTHDNKYH